MSTKQLLGQTIILSLALFVFSNFTLWGQTIFTASFETGTDGFTFFDDTFLGTNQVLYSDGNQITGFDGGALSVELGGINDSDINEISGGWERIFNLATSGNIRLTFQYNITQTGNYEAEEISQVLASIDGQLLAPGGFIRQLNGDGNGGAIETSNVRTFTTTINLTAGNHSLILGGYNNRKTLANESTQIIFDNVILEVDDCNAPNNILTDAPAASQQLVDNLSLTQYKLDIETMADFGDRSQFGAGSQSYTNAANWLKQELNTLGYDVEEAPYTYQGFNRTSIYVTKQGTTFPDRMYIVSAHFDGRGGGGAANDDASGSALVLEVARAFAPSNIQTDVSIRFIFWNNEETGLNGSSAYVNQRVSLQGDENPLGSNNYPEPVWMGMLQHDMMMFDHGLPPQANQIPDADIDVEYQINSGFAQRSFELGNILLNGNQNYSTDYPAELGNNMNNTDSYPFRNFCPAVSVRENQRVAEIGNGSNPHWHQPTDVYSTFSEEDFLLGFNSLQMTLGTVAQLANTKIVSSNCNTNGGDFDGDGICENVDCDDNNACVPTTPGTPCDDNNSSTQNDVIQADGCTCSGSMNLTTISLNAKVILQGAYNTSNNLMNDLLRQQNLIPLTQPYSNDLNFQHVGNEQTTNQVLNQTGENAIVDWVLLELRNANNPSQILNTRAALLQRDGDIVDVDGISPVSFEVSENNYFLSVRHRNHLGTMTENIININNNPTIDFTNPTLNLFGTNPTLIENNIQMLWSGNANSNETIIFQGTDNDPNAIFFDVLSAPNNDSGLTNFIFAGYSNSDLNMDGQIIYQGTDNEPNEPFFNVLTHPQNGFGISNYIIQEQLP